MTRQLHFRRIALAVTAAAAGATLLVTATPALGFGYRSPTAQASLETAAVLVAALAAFLILGRFRTSGRGDDLALLVALLTVAGSNLLFSTIPAATGLETGGRFFTWAVLTGRLAAAAVLAWAAFAPRRAVDDPKRALRRGLAVTVGLLALAAACGATGRSVSTGIDTALAPEDAGTALIQGSLPLLLLQLAMAALYAVAAAGFLRRAPQDELLGWFTVASILAAFSRVNYFLFPSIYAGWIYTGDLFRLGFYLVMLVGVVRQLAEYRRAYTHAAIANERRKVARDLHDGLAQELAYIAAQTRDLAARTGEPLVERLSLAADRAMDESRNAIEGLVRDRDESLDEGIWRVGEPIASRSGARLRVIAEPGIEASPEVHDGLLKITREALNNAARHGGGKSMTVTVGLSEGRLRLLVVDDGAGFETAEPGFGFTTMRERAEQLGGTLAIRSDPGAGTRVEVTFPWNGRSAPS